ncbi:redoxin domain-containing protein [Sanguibacter sp. Z1732]|uniref:redoxin domain-containing protein n=1 Tax=Sanguibacter sp. Z1732 TaxID=3435412 RepID=UPI003D9C8BD6
MVAISCDPLHSLRAWGDQEGFGLTLLSDFWPHGQVAEAYGAFDDEAGHAGRGSVLIDAGGAIAWSTLSPPGRTRSLTEHVDAVRALAAARVEEP